MCFKANPSDYLTYKHQQAATATSGIMLWHQYEITLFFLLSCFRIIPWVLFRLNFILVDQQWFKHKGIFKVTVLAVLIIWNVSISLPGFLGNSHVRELDSYYLTPTWLSYICSILCNRVGDYQFAPTFILGMVWLALCCLYTLAIHRCLMVPMYLASFYITSPPIDLHQSGFIMQGYGLLCCWCIIFKQL